jgi:hypothetical protein
MNILNDKLVVSQAKTRLLIAKITLIFGNPIAKDVMIVAIIITA